MQVQVKEGELKVAKRAHHHGGSQTKAEVPLKKFWLQIL